MAYVRPNFTTKKQLKEALSAGRHVHVFQPANTGDIPSNGEVDLEGPHYPQPHTWYATGIMENGKLVRIK